jgi:peptide chain release factor 3
MEIERQRDFCFHLRFSFNLQRKKINILDTPGHKDFAEDTFRTLTAVDSVIVVIDAKSRNKREKSVCRMRKIPISFHK